MSGANVSSAVVMVAPRSASVSTADVAPSSVIASWNEQTAGVKTPSRMGLPDHGGRSGGQRRLHGDEVRLRRRPPPAATCSPTCWVTASSWRTSLRISAKFSAVDQDRVQVADDPGQEQSDAAEDRAAPATTGRCARRTSHRLHRRRARPGSLGPAHYARGASVRPDHCDRAARPEPSESAIALAAATFSESIPGTHRDAHRDVGPGDEARRAARRPRCRAPARGGSPSAGPTSSMSTRVRGRRQGDHLEVVEAGERICARPGPRQVPAPPPSTP